MLVKDLMTTGISCVKETATLKQVAKQMKQENVGLIPVCNDKGEVLGVVTDRDLVLRALAREIGDHAGEKNADQNAAGAFSDLKAGDVMSSDIICASPDMNTHHAALLLAKYQIRRLPVTQNGKLVGMLSMADIARKPVFVDEAGDALSAICAAAPGNPIM
ncbi:MAG: CBS domain-containing protein [Firmicutes bacterium]|jgi:CBS domain-containing protein|nr:CBS domain-containing protein [Bacillota bacterium]NBI63141.1 CBS domain-containing protein [Clostridiales bacterium]